MCLVVLMRQHGLGDRRTVISESLCLVRPAPGEGGAILTKRLLALVGSLQPQAVISDGVCPGSS